MRRWRATCASWCASVCRPATAINQVLDFLVDRYGEFVLLRPRLHWRTSLLWLAPPVLLIGGAIALFVFARRRAPRRQPIRRYRTVEAALTPAEQARLARLLRSKER